MRELLDTVREWQAQGAALGRAVVVRTFGSAPRPEGANLVVTADGRLAGSVSGGCVEGAAFQEIQAARAAGVSRVIRYGISDEQAWDVGLACGGTIDVLVEPYVRPEVVAASRLVIVGAVQVAMPLARIARELGYETVVVDGRAAFATRERFPDVDRLVVGWPDEVADEMGLGPTDAVAVLTHDVKFDEPAIIEGLRRGCRYVGAVGSRKTQADRRARLRAAGVTDAELARLRGPIGLDLGGRAPAETALAIMAEVVAERYGGSGAPMRSLAPAVATA